MNVKFRTIVYIDGFNFYYGQLRGTPYKWLNLTKLFNSLLSEENNLIKIKYFTTRVSASNHDPLIAHRQNAYLRALEVCCPEVETFFGHFLRHRIFAENAYPPPEKIAIYKTEEKGSDVNLALHLLNDAWLDHYDCAVIVSNDSDLSIALKMVREERQKTLGLITPGFPKRRISKELKKHANFTKIIRPWILEQSLLPAMIPGTKIRKPYTW